MLSFNYYYGSSQYYNILDHDLLHVEGCTVAPCQTVWGPVNINITGPAMIGASQDDHIMDYNLNSVEGSARLRYVRL